MFYSAGGRRGSGALDFEQQARSGGSDLSRKGVAGHREGYSLAFVVVVALFVTALITANVTAVKLLGVFGLVLPAGVLVFPVSYICGDVLTEVYGYRVARRVIWLGFLCNLLAVAAIYLGGVLPAAPFWQDQQAYETILGYTPRLLAASFLAYLVGEFTNSYVLARMKVATNGRWLWSRTIGSTLVGQGLDSLVFVVLAFVGTIPIWAMVSAVVAQWLVKSAYEALATPLTYAVVNRLKHTEGVDAYDRDTNFNPLPVGR
jgi:queuosine precursor transporter